MSATMPCPFCDGSGETPRGECGCDNGEMSKYVEVPKPPVERMRELREENADIYREMGEL